MIEIPRLIDAFAQVLREARLEAGLSQEEVARRVSCARTFITALENMTYQPTLNAFVAIAFAIGLSPGELMRRVENRLAFMSYLDKGNSSEPSDTPAM